MSRASEIAYQEIRWRILSGALPPRTQLKEEELAELCGVSRTPVRDALRRLEAEMLVRRSDTQRSFVPDWSSDEVEEIFTLRALIESHAAARAAERITDEQLDRLRRANDAISTAIHAPGRLDAESFISNNRDFHNVVFEAAASERLAKMRGLLVEQVIQHRTANRYDPVGLLRSHADHDEMIMAFAAHDADWARSIMTSHIRRAYRVTVA